MSQICVSSSIGTISVGIVVVIAVVLVIIIRVIIIISKSPRKYLSNIPGKHEIKELQKKISRIGHCTHTTESAIVEVQNIFHKRNNATCSTNCKYRTAAALYALETWLVAST